MFQDGDYIRVRNCVLNIKNNNAIDKNDKNTHFTYVLLRSINVGSSAFLLEFLPKLSSSIHKWFENIHRRTTSSNDNCCDFAYTDSNIDFQGRGLVGSQGSCVSLVLSYTSNDTVVFQIELNRGRA